MGISNRIAEWAIEDANDMEAERRLTEQTRTH